MVYARVCVVLTPVLAVQLLLNWWTQVQLIRIPTPSLMPLILPLENCILRLTLVARRGRPVRYSSLSPDTDCTPSHVLHVIVHIMYHTWSVSIHYPLHSGMYSLPVCIVGSVGWMRAVCMCVCVCVHAYACTTDIVFILKVSTPLPRIPVP